MGSVEDVWAELQREDSEALREFQQRASTVADVSEIHALLQGSVTGKQAAKSRTQGSSGKSKDAPKKQAKKRTQHEGKQGKERKQSAKSEAKEEASAATTGEAVHRSVAEVMASIQREVHASGSEDGAQRRRALESIKAALFDQEVMDTAGYTHIFHEIAKPVLKRFSDPVHKCREAAVAMISCFLQRVSDVTPVIAYMFPALMQRIPADVGYDPDIQLFVHNLEEHEAYKRGKAVDRQDRSNVYVHHVVETSEEIRFELCRVIDRLLDLLQRHNAYSVLHPYFNETVLFVQTHLRDPFPELKVLACEVLTKLARIPHYELGLRHFAVALTRATLPVLRHRHARVRAVAVRCVHTLVAVPNRDKCKGAGTEAIADLVGFREENVLPVAAFYKPDVLINYLAELVIDHSAQVRHATATMLADWLTTLPDRYDHQARLLPYLLDLVCDDAVDVSEVALNGLVRCGELYEEEHPDEIIERRQYGVDGDRRANLSKPLPAPFKERPRIGLRLFVRGNTRRFLKALLGELTNWISKTRLNSVHLLRTVIVCCEEHLTADAHEMLPCFVRALALAEEEKDQDLKQALLEVCELTGRFTLPDTYLAFLLPRIRGDPEIVPYGIDATNRAYALVVLAQCIHGSRPNTLSPHMQEIVEAVTSHKVVPDDSLQLLQAAVSVVSALVMQLKDNRKGATEAHFLSTGRLTSFTHAITVLFSFLMASLQRPELATAARTALNDLAQLAGTSSVAEFYRQFSVQALQEVLASYPRDILWTPLSRQHACLESLVRWEGGIMESSAESVRSVLELCCAIVAMDSVEDTEDIDREEQHARLKVMGDLLLHSLRRANMSTALTDDVRAAWAAQVAALVRVLVLDPRWSASLELARRRQQLVELLVNTSLPVWSNASQSLHQVARPLLVHLVAEADDVKGTSAHRLRCVQLVHACAHHIAHLVFSDDAGGTASAPSRCRVLSASAINSRIQQLGPAHKALFDEAVHLLNPCMAALARRFEDSDDAVAAEAFDTLSTVLRSFGTSPIDFDSTCRKLLVLATGSGSSEAFVAHVEDLLRYLATFDRQAFTVALDAAEQASAEIAGTDAPISRPEVLEALRDHVQTLEVLSDNANM